MSDDLVNLGPFSGKPTPPEDWLRIIITLLFSLTLIVFLAFYFYFSVTLHQEENWRQIKEAFGVILPAVTGTLGTVIGFYFGKGSK